MYLCKQVTGKLKGKLFTWGCNETKPKNEMWRTWIDNDSVKQGRCKKCYAKVKDSGP